MTTSTQLGLHAHVTSDYEETIQLVTAALKNEGFGVLTEIDVQDTLKKKLDADFRRYVILGACNPVLANRAFNSDLDVGLLLPCNVVVNEDTERGGSNVSVVNPLMMMQMMPGTDLQEVAVEAHSRLSRVVASLANQTAL
jgi:uncharacterized protein (DUF302 family)